MFSFRVFDFCCCTKYSEFDFALQLYQYDSPATEQCSVCMVFVAAYLAVHNSAIYLAPEVVNVNTGQGEAAEGSRFCTSDHVWMHCAIPAPV